MATEYIKITEAKKWTLLHDGDCVVANGSKRPLLCVFATSVPTIEDMPFGYPMQRGEWISLSPSTGEDVYYCGLREGDGFVVDRS